MAQILIIDDDSQIRELLIKALLREGYEVVDAPNGKVGISLFRKSPSDVVITDLLMPEKEGIETIMELRRDFPGVKIIAISGGGYGIGAETQLRLARKIGACNTFTKPFKLKDLSDAVRQLLSEPAA